MDIVIPDLPYCNINSFSLESGPCDTAVIFYGYFFNCAYPHLTVMRRQCTPLVHVFGFMVFLHTSMLCVLAFFSYGSWSHTPALNSSMLTETNKNFFTFGQFFISLEGKNHHWRWRLWRNYVFSLTETDPNCGGLTLASSSAPPSCSLTCSHSGIGERIWRAKVRKRVSCHKDNLISYGKRN